LDILPEKLDLSFRQLKLSWPQKLQLESAGGVEETPFVMVKVTTGEDGNFSVEAIQVSQQCMAMVAEEALEIGPTSGICKINDTFTAIQDERKARWLRTTFS
jgi:nuclear protein localization family protein 4